MSFRPPNTHKDANHMIPRDFARDCCGGFEPIKFGRYAAYTFNYRGTGFLLVDTSAFGGVMPDWILENRENGAIKWLEVKTAEAYKAKNHSLKPGEEWLYNKSANFYFVVTDTDFEEILIQTMEA